MRITPSFLMLGMHLKKALPGVTLVFSLRYLYTLVLNMAKKGAKKAAAAAPAPKAMKAKKA